MKKVFILLALLFIIPHQAYATFNRSLPPLPKEKEHEEKISIVTLQEPLTREEIQNMISPYPNIQLRHVYTHALQGFSVQGPIKELEQLKQIKEIQHLYPSYPYEANGENSIHFIGTNEVRHILDEKGNRLTGKGIKIGVIDTGIDYNHFDLRKNFKGGKDFIDQDKDPMETINYGPYNTFHGTHVAGIIAANGKMKGIAPDAEIIAYRALGPGGFGTTEHVLAAIDQAIKDRVDIINLSLGTTINGPDLPTSIALDNAVKKGIIAVTSNGNSGPQLWTVGTPGTSEKAISVGASTPPLDVPYLVVNERKISIKPLIGSASWKLDRSYEIVYGGYGEEKELKQVDGKMVLLKRGKITFTQKALNALKHGAKAVLIFNNTEGTLQGKLDETLSIPVAGISKKDGEYLLNINGKTVLANIEMVHEVDQLADFSSRGPVTHSWDIKPEVVAPGVAIESTVPNGYLALDGTSMAAPHVTGACALIKQAHPDWSPEEVKAALMNTAKILYKKDGNPYKTYEQGAGRIQLDKAIETKSLIMPGHLLFGEVHGKRRDEKETMITIKNVSQQQQSYSFEIPHVNPELQWELPNRFLLNPGESKQVKISIWLKSEHKKSNIYDGFVKVHAGSQTIHLPYLYVVEEPNYPRIMGFSMVEGDRPNTYRYETYLPEGADEMGIALYDPDTHRFIQFIDWHRNVKRGMIKNEIPYEDLPQDGVYLGIIFARKDGKEDYIEQMIEIRKKPHAAN